MALQRRTAGMDWPAACGRLALQATGALVGSAFLSASATAQTAPYPTLPIEPPPAVVSSPDTSGQAAPNEPPDPFAGLPEESPDLRVRPRSWEYALGAGVGWNSNVNFDIRTDLAGDSVALSPLGSLSRIFWGPKGDLRADVAASFVSYPNQEINRHYVDLGLDGRYRTGSSTIWSVDGNYEIGNSGTSQLLIDQGLMLPQVETRTLTAQLSLQQKLGGRSGLTLTGRFYHLDFVDAAQYQPGRSIRGTLGLERRLSRGDTASLQYSIEDVLADEAGRTYLSHYGSLQWSHIISPRSGFLLEGGASYTPDAELAMLESEASFFGGVSYNRKVKQSDIRLYVRREVVPAFGFGVSRAETRGELNAAVPLGKDWKLTLLAQHTLPSAPAGVESFGSASTDLAQLSIGRRMRRKLELSANLRYRRRGPTDALSPTQEFVAGVFLTLLTPGAKALNQGF